jgi:hypothetical protein
MNTNHKISISLIFGFFVALAVGLYLGGEHQLMLEIDRIGKNARLPVLGLVVFFIAIMVAFFSYKLAEILSSPVLKKIFRALLATAYFLILISAGFTLGIIGLANRV